MEQVAPLAFEGPHTAPRIRVSKDVTKAQGVFMVDDGAGRH